MPGEEEYFALERATPNVQGSSAVVVTKEPERTIAASKPESSQSTVIAPSAAPLMSLNDLKLHASKEVAIWLDQWERRIVSGSETSSERISILCDLVSEGNATQVQLSFIVDLALTVASVEGHDIAAPLIALAVRSADKKISATSGPASVEEVVTAIDRLTPLTTGLWDTWNAEAIEIWTRLRITYSGRSTKWDRIGHAISLRWLGRNQDSLDALAKLESELLTDEQRADVNAHLADAALSLGDTELATRALIAAEEAANAAGLKEVAVMAAGERAELLYIDGERQRALEVLGNTRLKYNLSRSEVRTILDEFPQVDYITN